MNLESVLKMLGRNIAQLRKGRSLTQKQTADQIEMSYRYFQSIEAGKANITLSTLVRIAEVMQVQVRDLFSENNVQPS